LSKNAAGESGSAIIGLLTIELHFPEAQSLKAKRMVVKSIKERLVSRHHVAVAETGYLELWQRAELSVVSVSGTRHVLQSQLEKIQSELENNYSSELVGTEMELIE